ncbi:MAG: hypothetical protein QXM65_04340 [Candidatus Bathyarchaeia archaeon]
MSLYKIRAVFREQNAYNHPKSINQNSTPQYKNSCQNHVKVRTAIRINKEAINKPSFGCGRAFLIFRRVAPQTRIPTFRDARKFEVVTKILLCER